MVTEWSHPCIVACWSAGRIIGWERTFIDEVKDLLGGITRDKMACPDVYDGLRCQHVLDAALRSADEGRWVEIPES